MTQFKAGDKVYCLINTSPPKVYDLDNHDYCSKYPLDIAQLEDTYTIDGKITTNSPIPSLVLATQENYEMLCKLFPDTPWEQPPKHPVPREVIEKMFNDGWKSVPCYARDTKENIPNQVLIKNILLNKEAAYYDGTFPWKYCEPYDPKTGKLIVDYIDGKVILES